MSGLARMEARIKHSPRAASAALGEAGRVDPSTPDANVPTASADGTTAIPREGAPAIPGDDAPVLRRSHAMMLWRSQVTML